MPDSFQPQGQKEFSRQGYWKGLPFLSLGHLTDPGMESGFPAQQVDSL